jgi:hypothetical protein
MSSAQIFVNTLENHFKRNPFGDGFAKKLEPYCREIGPDVAEEVANRLCAPRKAFPDLQACTRALKAAEGRLTTPGSVGPKPWEKPDHRGEWEAKKRAWNLCRCDLGRQADRDGWLLSLVEFATEHRRLPEGREIGEVQAWSRKLDTNLHRNPKPVFYSMLCGLRDAMKERAHADVFGFIDAKDEAA